MFGHGHGFLQQLQVDISAVGRKWEALIQALLSLSSSFIPTLLSICEEIRHKAQTEFCGLSWLLVVAVAGAGSGSDGLLEVFHANLTNFCLSILPLGAYQKAQVLQAHVGLQVLCLWKVSLALHSNR